MRCQHRGHHRSVHAVYNITAASVTASPIITIVSAIRHRTHHIHPMIYTVHVGPNERGAARMKSPKKNENVPGTLPSIPLLISITAIAPIIASQQTCTRTPPTIVYHKHDVMWCVRPVAELYHIIGAGRSDTCNVRLFIYVGQSHKLLKYSIQFHKMKL